MRLVEGKKIVERKHPLFAGDGSVYDATGKKHNLLQSRYPEQPLMDRLPYLKRAMAKGKAYFYFKGEGERLIPLPNINEKEFAWEYQVLLAERFGRERPAVRQKGRSWVYFIGAQSGPIKIGHSQSPEKRIFEMQCGNPDKLFLYGKFRGGQPLEQRLHRKLAAHRVRGEWFERCAQVFDALKALADHPERSRGGLAVEAETFWMHPEVEAWREHEALKSRALTFCQTISNEFARHKQ